jgi:hypothetical protein
VPVFIFTHKQEWIEGKVTRYGGESELTVSQT